MSPRFLCPPILPTLVSLRATLTDGIPVVGSSNDRLKEPWLQTPDEEEEPYVKIIRGGTEITIDVHKPAPGDVALLEPGETVPCDGVFSPDTITGTTRAAPPANPTISASPRGLFSHAWEGRESVACIV